MTERGEPNKLILRKVAGMKPPGQGAAFAHSALLPDGRTVMRAVAKDVLLWDVTTGAVVAELPKSASDTPKCAAASKDGRFGAIGFQNGKIRIVDLVKKKSHKQLGGHDWVTQIAFLADGRLVSVGTEGTLRLWDAVTGEEISNDKAHNSCTHCTTAANGTIATSGYDGVAVRPAGGAPRWLDSGKRWSFASVTPDGSRVVASNSDNELRVWDAASGKVVASWSQKPSGDQNLWLVHAISANRVLSSDWVTVSLWDVEKQKTISTVKTGKNMDYGPAFDGRLLVCNKATLIELDT